MDERELSAIAAVLGGLLLGALIGSLTRKLVLRRERRTQVSGLAAPAGAFVFWVFLALGVAIAVSILSPAALDPVAEDALAYLPNVLIAVLLLIVGRALGSLLSSVFGASLARATGRTRREAAVALKTTIYVVTAVLVLGQLGVNTTLLTLLAAALLFGAASALALLVGLGGRGVASEVAAGRYLRRIVTVGAQIDADGITGTVVALHAATTEVSTGSDGTVHIPNTVLLASPLQVRQAPKP